MQKVPVLIVGGGPVGLALAAELGWRGVRCELIEQGDGAIVTPKMNEVNVRTMEFCRRWGIADQVLNCPFPADYPFDVVFVTSLGGHEIGRIPRRPCAGRQTPEPYSPMRLQACSQMWFDPILRDFALSSPSVRLRYRTRLEAFEDTGAGVAADIVDLESGARERIEAPTISSAATAPPARSAARSASVSTGRACSAIRCICSSAHPTSQAMRQGARHVLPRHRPRRAVGQHPHRRSGQRHVAADGARQRRQADAGDHRQGRADPPRGRPADRRRMARAAASGRGEASSPSATARAACSLPATPCISFRRPARSA